MTNFPTSLDDGSSLPNPSATDKTNNPDHAGLHGDTNNAIKALEAKLGIGASTPVANRIMFGDGTGTSAWTQLTSAQLAASLSDETGIGAAVFANTPTLVTPKVDTINENTPGNGVTIDGLSIKDNKLNTNDSVVTANITDSAVTTSKIASAAIGATNISTSAIDLGKSSITSNVTVSATSVGSVAGLAKSVVIPAGGRTVIIKAVLPWISAASTSVVLFSLWEGTVGSGTQLIETRDKIIDSSDAVSVIVEIEYTPSAGSKTFNLGAYKSGGNATINASSVSPAYISIALK